MRKEYILGSQIPFAYSTIFRTQFETKKKRKKLFYSTVHQSILNTVEGGEWRSPFGFYTPILCRILADFCILADGRLAIL